MTYLFDIKNRVYARSTMCEKPSVVTDIADATQYASCKKAFGASTTFGKPLGKYAFFAFTFDIATGKYRNTSDGLYYESPEDCVPDGGCPCVPDEHDMLPVIDRPATDGDESHGLECGSSEETGDSLTATPDHQDHLQDTNVSGGTHAISRQDIENAVASLCQIMREMNADAPELAKNLGTVDRKISDVLHFLELNSFNAVNGYHLSKRLKDLRIERRNIKDRMAWNAIMKNLSYTSVTTGDLVKSLQGLDTRKYTPREPDSDIV